MKNYKTPEKTKEFYFNTELSFLIVPVLIACIITYGLLSFFGTTVAILFNVIISFCANLYVYAYGRSYSRLPFDLLITTAITSCLLLFGNYGVYALVIYQNTRVFNKLYFSIWLALLFGTPILYYIFLYSRHYFTEKTQATEYLKVLLKVHHDRELLTVIDYIQFVSTSNKTMSDIKLEKPLCFYSKDELFKLKKSNSSIHHYLEKNVFSSLIHLPFESDVLFMAWYSIVEDKYYDIEVPFPFEKLEIEQEKYPTDISAALRGKKTKPLQLHIHTNGGIRLFNEDIILIDHLESTPTAITEEKRNEKITHHRSSHDYYKNTKAFSELIQKIKSSNGIEERFLIKNKLILWSMSVSGLKGNNYLDVFDVSFSKYKIEINDIETSQLRFLPKKIEIVYRGNYLYRWLTLRIDTQQLYKSIQKLTAGNDHIGIRFDLVVGKLPETDLKFHIITDEKSVLFTDWEIQIDKENNQNRIDHLLDIDEDQQKRTLYKDAWELVTSKQYDLAQEKCNTIKAIDPRFGFAYFLEVRLLWYKEGSEACYAKEDYFIAKTKHEPAALAHIYNNYGCLLDEESRYEESRYEESLSYFEKAILSNPKEGIYVCNLAELYCKLKQPKKAMEAAEKSKTLGHQSSTLNALLNSKGTRYF